MNRFKKATRYFSLLSMILLISHSVKAESPPPPSSISNPFVVIMLIIIGILALAIGILANVVMGAAMVQAEKEKEAAAKNKASSATTAAVLIGLLLLTVPGLAQEKAAGTAAAAANLTDGISTTAFYMIAGVIFVELMVILVLLYNLRLILNIERRRKAVVQAAATAAEHKPRISWWDRFNKFKPIEQEVDIDLGHDYDGIRELDNRLPPWWLYGFYACILFAFIYLWRYHVAHSAPLSGEEYQIAMQEAAIQKEAYLKKAASNIDETNVKFMGGAGNLAAGKNIFETICSACHGKAGQGVVGPNLTDDYWLHGGSINDIFKTIKYGYPEKGMKSWKDDYSPTQIADLASYILTLHGTNPPGAKAPQGTLYAGQAAAPAPGGDSASKTSDSANKRTPL